MTKQEIKTTKDAGKNIESLIEFAERMEFPPFRLFVLLVMSGTNPGRARNGWSLDYKTKVALIKQINEFNTNFEQLTGTKSSPWKRSKSKPKKAIDY